MPIQLDKILDDIANEKALHPNLPSATKKEIDDAWARVGKNNNLSVHESRSIFKVLQKKYEQERIKDNSAWKLFAIMDKIHQKVEIKSELKDDDDGIPIEEDEEYEMLEVQEDDESTGQNISSAGTCMEGDNSTKDSNSHTTTMVEKDDKPIGKHFSQSASATATASNTYGEHTQFSKLLNSMASTQSRNNSNNSTSKLSSASNLSLQKKGITVRKTFTTTTSNQAQTNKSIINVPGNRMLEVGKTIQLPESLKRKLSEDQASATNIKKAAQQNLSHSQYNHIASSTKMNSNSNSNAVQNATQIEIKQERTDDILTAVLPNQENIATVSAGINVITIPANPTPNSLVNGLITTSGGGGGGGGASSSTAATVASTSTNGYSPRLETIDFRNDIIFDNTNTNGVALSGKIANTSEYINLGNFDNSLPPTFFKNLCNSSRHEALGLYLANVMNRLRPRSAAKLELGILRAIIDVQNEEFEQ